MSKLAEKHAPQIGMTLLNVAEHRELFAQAGFSDVQIVEEGHNGWICGIGERKP